MEKFTSYVFIIIVIFYIMPIIHCSQENNYLLPSHNESTSLIETSTSRIIKKINPESYNEPPVEQSTVVAVSVTLATLLITAFATAFIVKFCCTREEGHLHFKAQHANSINKTIEDYPRQTSLYQSIVHHHHSPENIVYVEVENIPPPISTSSPKNPVKWDAANHSKNGDDVVIFSEIFHGPSSSTLTA